jgi:hypothetical protein
MIELHTKLYNPVLDASLAIELNRKCIIDFTHVPFFGFKEQSHVGFVAA